MDTVMDTSRERGISLEVTGLSAGYSGRAVVSGISFTVRDADILAVVGPNGSGKTTLIKAMLGLLPPLGGTVRLFGKERLTRQEARDLIAYIPQRIEPDRSLPLTLSEFLSMSPVKDPAAAEPYIKLLELTPLMSQRVGQLSGGQLQRAMLAYSMAKAPRLIIMDEPTSWVDARGADCMICMLREFKSKGVSMVIVTHDLTAVGSMATHVLGLGAEGSFHLPSDSPEINSRILGLLGTAHHSEEAGHYRCIHMQQAMPGTIPLHRAEKKEGDK